MVLPEIEEKATLIICLRATITSQLSSENWQVPNHRLKKGGIKPPVKCSASVPRPHFTTVPSVRSVPTWSLLPPPTLCSGVRGLLLMPP